MAMSSAEIASPGLDGWTFPTYMSMVDGSSTVGAVVATSPVDSVIAKRGSVKFWALYIMTGWNHELPKGSEIRCPGKSECVGHYKFHKGHI